LKQHPAFTPGLEATLAEVSRIAAELADEWWVIGSAAIALTGVDIEVLDVDLLLSARDARALLDGWAAAKAAADDQDRFRSIRGVHTGTPIPIEVMGALEVKVEDRWVRVTPNTREAVDLAGGRIFIPDTADQLALLLMFRRPQDLVRAEMLMRG
jgi:hypothetical protein